MQKHMYNSKSSSLASIHNAKGTERRDGPGQLQLLCSIQLVLLNMLLFPNYNEPIFMDGPWPVAGVSISTPSFPGSRSNEIPH